MNARKNKEKEIQTKIEGGREQTDERPYISNDKTTAWTTVKAQTGKCLTYGTGADLHKKGAPTVLKKRGCMVLVRMERSEYHVPSKVMLNLQYAIFPAASVAVYCISTDV